MNTWCFEGPPEPAHWYDTAMSRLTSVERGVVYQYQARVKRCWERYRREELEARKDASNAKAQALADRLAPAGIGVEYDAKELLAIVDQAKAKFIRFGPFGAIPRDRLRDVLRSFGKMEIVVEILEVEPRVAAPWVGGWAYTAQGPRLTIRHRRGAVALRFADIFANDTRILI